MLRQFELVERVKSYDPTADEDAINRAYVYAMKMHGSQMRASGDPYFSHPIEVAGILTNYRLDTASIVTALLHDTVEDTGATSEEIASLFGEEVARLVDGVTKLTRIQLQNVEAKQAENFRKLLLAMSEDIRVLLVKLADRLHNMRTLNHISKPEKRRNIALETMEIYAPLAERLGMQEIKTELEDLAFAELHPEARTSILARLRFLEREGGDLVGRIMDELDQTIQASELTGYVSGREKTPYSIWKKMQIQDVSFEQLSDIMAFRIMVDDNADCYRALGIVHAAYRTVPGRIKDHISTPKRNGYQSIHTSIIGPEKHRIEVQIRTKSMHEIAELGVAAHWQYKQGLGDVAGSQYSWLRELLDILEHAQTPEEFLEHTKLEMFQDQVFCFTPKGELITLPKGASPVDFAYAVHTEVGNTCVGAKVNGRIVPLRIELHTGDQVEIAVSKAQKPSPEWEGFVITGKARAHIRRRVRMEAHEEYAKLGKEILSKMFVKEAYDLTDDGLNEAAEKLDYHDRTDVYAAVGEGQVMARQVLEAVYPGVKTSPQTKVVNISKARRQNAGAAESAVPIKGLTPGLALHLSECCHPLPGDRIVGILKAGKGVDVHTIDCESLIELAEEPENWLDIVWDNKKTGDMLLGRVNLTVLNEPGSLGALSTVIAQNQGNISNLKIVGRSNDFFEMDLDIEVTSVKHLTNIIAALRASPAINSVERARG
ncbi:MAG: bifunctional (p)ppGpp synthetase/guanosine-3',5'-bis(diphosphate) 3'-pyrophosphohydrolase [Rhodospirillaceae bacterium]|jgi:GTP diphosphokinase / guanosine-3',5'-bis(diphosphate) 3'-diphosphatase|nr:bifunctional (p)ppGpp synthetase/guanosine-3',5'-bis(diphosphate) 3'-pyrophosphohydrolase [Rhodospirillaceae bacterium]MBT5239803.1 bifunctional (p)ppGpp synthetase/guanosine-3',5'-bis(diphosphate) 3'-pyrophosphohydrolase [Rhodospirillaceae bacterium]MBT5567181.1 bifunctional (p)ppGpp synthetase/guanosine-3',5'-bis(diphosphate) 3'-pyrophosphohydrolase [Rhodospirillaceae bacterium]MBT6089394.1 bifunctional (p)ppGpp synthetase/guanosine-3',5'-bis(diphosphate) 3'-pyrophosphohydrolase [Rhodospiri